MAALARDGGNNLALVPTSSASLPSRVTSTALFGFLAILAACSKTGGTPNANADAGSSTSVVPADATVDGGAHAGSDDVEPVYPIEPNAPAVPLAAKLCASLNDLPEKKRADCCKTNPGIVVTSECTRTLSAALRHGAVEIDPGAADACLAAFERVLDGCDWVGPFPPGPPAACEGIVKGKLAAGQKCRSSLECSGTLRCLGVGPTTPGKCGPPKADGEICGGTVDTLAEYTRQSGVDRAHPECKDRCVRHKCAPPVAASEPCQTTTDCAEGLACIQIAPGTSKSLPKKVCTAGKLPGKDGEACPGGECETGLSCILGKCATRRPAGAACKFDFECRGGCLREDGGTKGKCGPRCDLR